MGAGRKGAAVRTMPKVEVTDDDDIHVDGVEVCAPGDLWYARLFGLAQMEKVKDPEWHIANGLVDRCYYRGSSKSTCVRIEMDGIRGHSNTCPMGCIDVAHKRIHIFFPHPTPNQLTNRGSQAAAGHRLLPHGQGPARGLRAAETARRAGGHE